jgi:hypothetical protein
MLRALRRHPLLAALVEVLVDAARYVAILLLVLMVVAQAARLAF